MEQEENHKNSSRMSWNNQNGKILLFGREDNWGQHIILRLHVEGNH